MSQDMGPQEPGDTGRSGFVNRWRSEAGRRPTFVYVVVGVVVVTLTILLAVIYFSASERERTSPPICTDIALAEAQEAVLQGDVDRLTVVYDDTPHTPTSERYGPVLAKLDYFDGTCSNLPQGVRNQEVVYTISGVIAFYNENTDEQQVEVTYQESTQLNESLFALPTATPTFTPTAEPTATSVATPTPIVSVATPGRATPGTGASPAASPAATIAPEP